jgi:hypothetical protein
MPAQDMLDVVHYFFESDAVGEKEEQDAKRKLRGVLYNQLYDRPYTWGADETGGTHEFGTQETASGEMFSSSQLLTRDTVDGAPGLTHKPYIPPTPMDASSPKPFGNLLDEPLG